MESENYVKKKKSETNALRNEVKSLKQLNEDKENTCQSLQSRVETAASIREEMEKERTR